MSRKSLVRTGADDGAAQAPSILGMMSPVTALQREIERVFDAFSGWPSELAAPDFRPRLEVAESDNAIVVNAEVPGIDEKDIHVAVTDNVLTIRGEKREEKDEKRKSMRLIERSYGAFERSIALPEGVDADRIAAKLDKGVLRVEIPRPAGAKEKTIPIRS
jgi:HSP20 family protein